MPSLTGCLRNRLLLSVVPLLFSSLAVEAAIDPRFELDSKSIGELQSPTKAAAPADRRRPPARADKKKIPLAGQGTPYTVKAGDHLFKILMRDYGLTNDEAESFIEEIRRENNIYDIRKLKIGQKIIIPPVRRRSDGSLKLAQPAQGRYQQGAEQVVSQAFRLESTAEPLSDQQALSHVRDTWEKLVPVKSEPQKPLSIQNSTFSLTLDPQRYPMLATMGNGRILLDYASSIPPLVKSLIEEKDPGLKIVSEHPAAGSRFLASIVESAGFYSVEENFTMDFGVDPKLTVHSDFKIEKTPESLIKQDIVLLNAGRGAIPPVLGEFLKKEGFSVYEPFAQLRPFLGTPSRQIHVVTAKKQSDVVDAVLSSLAQTVDHDRRLDVFAADNNGISLSVKAERYFERGGQRYIVTRFDGDPVTYTLFRLLETKGYRVVILEGQDDFRKVTEKILGRMKLRGAYAQHNLVPSAAGGYSLQMSGFRLEDPSLPGGQLFVTNLELDRIIRDLLVESGYSIKGK